MPTSEPPAAQTLRRLHRVLDDALARLNRTMARIERSMNLLQTTRPSGRPCDDPDGIAGEDSAARTGQTPPVQPTGRSRP